MSEEIVFEKERKFLTRNDESWREAAEQAEKRIFITQGYILIDPERGIGRVRINRTAEGKFLNAKIEVKLHTTDKGAPELPTTDLDEATAMQCLIFTKGTVVEKIRHYVRHGELLFEIDEFLGRHHPLAIIELEHDDPTSITRTMLPVWVGKEVTGNRNYDNVALAQH